jgi:hypothetical protein
VSTAPSSTSATASASAATSAGEAPKFFCQAGFSQVRAEPMSARQAAARSGVSACRVPRIAQVFISVPSPSARTSPPGSGFVLRSPTASSAAEATWACTPHKRPAMATAPSSARDRTY